MAKPHSSHFLLITFLVLCAPSSLQQQPQQKISAVDLAALLAIKTSLTDLPGTHFFTTWDFSSPDPCSTFAGVICSLESSTTLTLRVTSLTLGTGLSDSPGLTGSLSPSISRLSELTQLVLFPGIVTGPIPSQFGYNLRVISLTNNRLTGSIPTSLCRLKNLHTLDLSYNRLTGAIPPSLTKLPQLKVLILASNRLSSELPPVSTQLLHLDLKKNGFIGRLPSLPSSIRYLSLSENSLWGPLNGLVESLSSGSELVYLDLSMNQFSGPIPPSLFHYSSSLSSIFLQRNNLSGGLPPIPINGTTPPSYGQGSIIDLSHNYLTGEISSILAGAETLFLNNNRMMGTVPEEYVKSVYQGSTRTLYLQHNYITEFRLEPKLALPDTASLCLSYNCMVPPVGLAACPISAGHQLSRPAYQCSAFYNGSGVRGYRI